MIRHTIIEGNNIAQDCEIDFDLTCDILVIGLGTAGAIAAIAAGRRGHSVIGVDLAPIPGGVGTAGCVWDYYYGANGGLYEEINAEADRLIETDRYMNSTNPGYKKSYPTTVKALALENKLAEVGAECFYSTLVTDVFTEGENVVGAAFIRNGKSFTVGAKVVIDGAEGEVFKLLGVKNLGGRRSDNKTARFSRTVGVLSSESGSLRVHGLWKFCEQFSGLDAYESAKMTYKWTAAEPGLCDRFSEKNRLYSLGCETAKREVFCCETEKVYTFRDYLDKNRPDDVIFYTFAPLDNSNPEYWDEDEEFQDWQGLCDMHAYGYTTGVTPGMLIPKGVGQLLLAGKHIGTGHTMSAGVRMRTDMEKCGEAAGVMASLMLEKGCKSTELTAKELREVLSVTKCYNKSNDRGICDLNLPDGEMWKTIELAKTPAELKPILSSIHPAPGLFAVRCGEVEATEELVGWLDEGGLLAENSAVALGLIGDKRALPTLREILSRDPEIYTYHSPNRYFFPWIYTTDLCNFVKAACLVARFNDPADRELLEALASYSGDNAKRLKAANYAKKKIRA